jgi:hypothetical protein
MMWFKTCPRCKLGDITLDEDNYRLCLQCGYVQYSAAEPGVAPEAAGLFHLGYADLWRTLNERAGQGKTVAV